MASLGWRGLNFFGRGGGLIIDVARPDADKRSVMEYLHLAEPDLLVFQLDTDYLYRPNFFVAIDRRLSAIILSIRGTMSMRDTLTDLVCEYVPWGTTGGLVHSGILEAAKWFDTNVVPMMLRWATEYNVSNIYLVGHSLGGASSALTTVLLMEKLSKEPSLWPTYRYYMLVHTSIALFPAFFFFLPFHLRLKDTWMGRQRHVTFIASLMVLHL